MSKFNTALKLFSEKMPNMEIRSIERTYLSHFKVVTVTGEHYVVDISMNSIDLYYDDPEY